MARIVTFEYSGTWSVSFAVDDDVDPYVLSSGDVVLTQILDSMTEAVIDTVKDLQSRDLDILSDEEGDVEDADIDLTSEGEFEEEEEDDEDPEDDGEDDE